MPLKKLSAYIYPPTILQRVRYSIDGNSLPQSITRLSLFFCYLFACLRQWAIPWHYFQLNSRYFNRQKGIFSKLEMDEHIPVRLRLNQNTYHAELPPDKFPVFLKPEWGQNSNGIVCVRNKKEYRDFADFYRNADIPYIVQEAASGKKEFEIYYLRSPEEPDNFSFLSITDVKNRGEDEYPINSIHNSATVYRDVTGSFTETELHKIWQCFGAIGGFRMARIGVKADDREALLQGHCKIIEINLFLPMPLVLLSENVQSLRKFIIIQETMTIAAKLVTTLPREETRQWIFFRKIKAHYKTAS